MNEKWIIKHFVIRSKQKTSLFISIWQQPPQEQKQGEQKQKQKKQKKKQITLKENIKYQWSLR